MHVTIIIKLLNSKQNLHAQDNKVLIETIEIRDKNYQTLNGKGKVATLQKPI